MKNGDATDKTKLSRLPDTDAALAAELLRTSRQIATQKGSKEASAVNNMRTPPPPPPMSDQVAETNLAAIWSYPEPISTPTMQKRASSKESSSSSSPAELEADLIEEEKEDSSESGARHGRHRRRRLD